MYKLNAFGNVIRISDGASIPDCAENRDWIEYQAWVAGGNSIAPAEPLETLAQTRLRALADIRDQRAPLLDALNGIASRAARKGETVTAEAADVAAYDLLNITKWPAFLEATTYESMRQAVKARYAQIVMAAPYAVQVVFKEVVG